MNYSSALKSSIFGQKPHHHKRPTEELRETMLPMTVLADETFGIAALGELDIESFYEAASNLNLIDEPAVQLQLPLESPQALLAHYRLMIHRYEQGYERMAAFALKWHSLMADVEHDPTIKKMFTDMQVMRKLTGSTLI
jgi:hypothetical protein